MLSLFRRPSRRPPGPPALPVVGHLVDYARDPINFPLRAALAYGDFLMFDLAGYPTYLVVDSDEIERILVKEHARYHKDRFTRGLAPVLGQGLLVSEGSFWRRQRHLLQPAFHWRRIRAYADVMVEHTRRMLEGWRPGDLRDVHREMMHLTLGIVGRTLFGSDVSADADTVGECLEVVMNHYLGFFNTGLVLPPSWPTPGNRRFTQAVARIDEVLYRMIEARRRQPPEARGDDLLGTLLELQDEAGDRMTEKQLRDEVVTLVLAGHETTALALTFTFMLLAEHRTVARKMHEELDRVLGDRPAGFDDVERLVYTGHVVQESMRLYPPAWGMGREAIEPVTIAGYDLPAGSQILIMPWVNHRHPRYFDEPEVFRPERWENDLAKRLPRFAYFPFGGGPRICIGNAFARMEAVLILATVAQQFELVRADTRPLELVPTITLRPKHGLPMRLWPRDRAFGAAMKEEAPRRRHAHELREIRATDGVAAGGGRGAGRAHLARACAALRAA